MGDANELYVLGGGLVVRPDLVIWEREGGGEGRRWDVGLWGFGGRGWLGRLRWGWGGAQLVVRGM